MLKRCDDREHLQITFFPFTFPFSLSGGPRVERDDFLLSVDELIQIATDTHLDTISSNTDRIMVVWMVDPTNVLHCRVRRPDPSDADHT